MAISPDIEILFDDELTTSVDIDGVSVDIIAGPVEQARSDFDQALINTWRIVVRVDDFTTLVMGQSLVVNNRDWTVDGILDAGVGAVELTLMRYLS
jgi:hypothetical protein